MSGSEKLARKKAGQITNPVSDDVRLDALLAFLKAESSGPGPKRARLHRAMIKMIEQGLWNPGDRLPNDTVIASYLPLSLVTVQASLNMLADQKFITREKQKGSFVSSASNLPRDYFYFRFADAETGNWLGIKTLSFKVEETPDGGPWSDFLGKNRTYLKVSRIISVDGEFNVYSEMYFIDPKIRFLLDTPPDALKDIALQQLVHVRFGLPAVSFKWSIAFENINANYAPALGVSEGTISQQFSVAVNTINDTPLVFHRFWVPKNRHSLKIDFVTLAK